MVKKTYFVVRGTQKIQCRDSAGRFLPKRVKYITKSCPKTIYSCDLSKAKLFSSYARANYALHGINIISDNGYYFDIIKVELTFQEK